MQEIVQSTLEKVRTLSHALHPVILDEIGFEGALDQYLPGFEKQTASRCSMRSRAPAANWTAASRSISTA